MIILGLVLLVVGIFTGMSILTTIGVILMVVGAILWILGASGRADGGRPHYWRRRSLPDRTIPGAPSLLA
jgi:uncharacterized membrane protein HdeD (DUF308 family)